MADTFGSPGTEERFDGTGGLKINLRSWRPAGKPRAVVFIVPGFNAHSGQYGWVADQLVADGLAVYAVDLRGRGKSDGERYYVEKFADYVSDVDGGLAIARSREPGLPIFLFGHSAGGVTACYYTIEHQGDLAGFICESFAFQVPAPDFAIEVLKGLSHLVPHAHVLHLKNEDFSRDPNHVADLNNDPLIANETQPVETVAELARADDYLKKNFPRITLPVLIMHGTNDHATRPSGSQLFFDTTGSTDKTLKFYQDYFHDPLSDIGKEQVMSDMIAWLKKHLPAKST